MRRHALANAPDPIQAICLSTTELNSSKTANLGASQISRAKLVRNCSPLLNAWYGRNHVGTLPKPTDASAAVTSLTAPLGLITSTIGAFFAHFGAYGLPNFLPILVLPEPDGPTITPICQSRSCNGRSTVKSKFAPDSTLNNDLTVAAR